MKSFSEILRNKNTDKVQFAEFYDTLFTPLRDEPINLLEIGIAQGGSVKTWLEFFPNAQIYAIDNRPETLAHLKNEPDERMHLSLIDAGQSGMLGMWLPTRFDIIIDDGSHINRDQLIAFQILWPSLNVGGYYIIEDVQVSHLHKYVHPEYPKLLDYFEGYPFCDKISGLWDSELLVIKKADV